jgi:hypothetical protein
MRKQQVRGKLYKECTSSSSFYLLIDEEAAGKRKAVLRVHKLLLILPSH